MNNYKIKGSVIASPQNLAKALNLTLEEINAANALSTEKRYKEKNLPKADGNFRKIYKPNHRIRTIQRRLNKRIFSSSNVIEWPSYLYGSIPNTIGDDEIEMKKDYVTCASIHCQAKSVLKIDVKDFFDNIHSDLIFNIFIKLFKYPQEVAELLTDLCTYKNKLPQGGLTSSYLACLSLFDVEPDVVKRLENKDVKYTRFVDDITISSQHPNYDFSFAKKLVFDMLHSKDLPINEAKTTVQRLSSAPILVHGLRISFKEPRLPPEEARQIRAAVRNIEKLSKHPDYRTSNAYKKDYNKCIGRVNKLARVKHIQHKKLISRLRKVKPLPNRQAVIRARSMIRQLEHIYPTHLHDYWYKKKYFQAHERLNIIQRSFPNIAKTLRFKLKTIRPQYE
ncbi:reverse transcriptase family protein [Cobetia sp. 4B]|uniref:reverse transcriptase family protein n=1 Tax=Cobetia sp. 4B TaxID=2758724 RepID=UPI001C05D0E5|nr:reverse transcriptase family protein [Cobetia sp. 4B]